MGFRLIFTLQQVEVCRARGTDILILGKHQSILVLFRPCLRLSGTLVQACKKLLHTQLCFYDRSLMHASINAFDKPRRVLCAPEAQLHKSDTSGTFNFSGIK